MIKCPIYILILLTISILTGSVNICFGQQDSSMPTANATADVRTYIQSTWIKLLRSNTIFNSTDDKYHTYKNFIYVSRKEDLNKIINEFRKTMPAEVFKQVSIQYLPRDITQIKQHGLLYLPNSYIVPGGRFNEMYGWDSYFIELGLLENNRFDLAKDIIGNLIYEVNYYGMILNANRTYYLQRSQPPLLSEMVLAYYNKTHDKVWLAKTLPALENLYHFWISPSHLIPNIGLSRYCASGRGPTPEEAPVYYTKARNYFKQYPVGDYDKRLYYDAKKNQLTPLFYKADRTVRESGFDITAKYGPFGASILDYAPVDLNVLLYQHEKDLSTIYSILNNEKASQQWASRADKRAGLINKYMWNNSLGYYFDYNFKTHQQRPYVFATTFYPLWAGISSKQQAQAVANNLPNLLAEGGIVTSTYRSQLQWDAPFGWAPMQYFAVFGLDHYGYENLAIEVSKRFINTVNQGFLEAHELYEKYDVQNATTQTLTKISYGYSTNEPGFGWTNGVYLSLTDYLDRVAICKCPNRK